MKFDQEKFTDEMKMKKMKKKEENNISSNYYIYICIIIVIVISLCIIYIFLNIMSGSSSTQNSMVSSHGFSQPGLMYGMNPGMHSGIRGMHPGSQPAALLLPHIYSNYKII